MPTVLRIGKFAFRLYLNDHEPPHVHVVVSDGEARIQLQPYVALLGVHGLRRTDATEALRLTQQHQSVLLSAWRNLHGE
jgi:hypothetical protein